MLLYHPFFTRKHWRNNRKLHGKWETIRTNNLKPLLIFKWFVCKLWPQQHKFKGPSSELANSIDTVLLIIAKKTSKMTAHRMGRKTFIWQRLSETGWNNNETCTFWFGLLSFLLTKTFFPQKRKQNTQKRTKQLKLIEYKHNYSTKQNEIYTFFSHSCLRCHDG